MTERSSTGYGLKRARGGSSLGDGELHENVIEGVLADASRLVETRIAHFRALLALLLGIFTAQNFLLAGISLEGPFLPLSLVSCALALGFSLFVLANSRRQRRVPVVPLAIMSIGVDATLMVLPVGLFTTEAGWFTSNEVILNQPSVFAMYLLVIASGLRFRDVARLGILVNGCVILSLMVMEAVRSRVPEGIAPAASLALRQHVLLLGSSVLLAWLISTHIRQTTLLAAQTALQATVDALTGVYNRTHLRQRLAFLCQGGQPFHLMMTDVDHFKRINDELGHPVGDKVLVEVARRFQASLRPGDLLARYGGEEFCIVLTRVEDEAALTVAERLRCKVGAETIEGRKVTTSVGLSRWNGTEPLGDLFERADQALYKAKEQGRDRVVCQWPEEFLQSAAGNRTSDAKDAP